MAISLKDIYTYIVGATSAYPWGSFKNATGSGTLDGTPFEKQWANDVYGFLQRTLVVAGVTPSGAPDTAETSQYFDAVESIMWQPGDTKFCMYANPNRRWLEMNGDTVGNAASEGTARANADTFGLFAALWTLASAVTPMYESGGSLVGARGASAAADFAANRKIVIPDARGVVPRGWDHGRGLDPGRVLGSYQADEIKAHRHAVMRTDDDASDSGAGGGYGIAPDYDAPYMPSATAIDAPNATSLTGGPENRVKSLAGMFVIRY